MKFQNGFLYKTTSLQETEREMVMQFLNNQSNATQAMHLIVLNHIRQYGTGNIDINVQSKMLQQQSILQTIEKEVTSTLEQPKESFKKETTRKSLDVVEKQNKASEANDKKIDTSAF